MVKSSFLFCFLKSPLYLTLDSSKSEMPVSWRGWGGVLTTERCVCVCDVMLAISENRMCEVCHHFPCYLWYLTAFVL